MEGCCYFFSLRMGCILSALWLLLYYSVLAVLMYLEIVYTSETETPESKVLKILKKVTIGFWVLGITYLVMDFMALLLLFGAILRRYPLIILFMFGQIVPICVESYYLVVAIMYGLEVETFVLYLMPLGLLIYIDLAAYSLWDELRTLKRSLSISTITIEY